MRLIGLMLCASLAACVTPGDLRDLAADIETVETRVETRGYATEDDVREVQGAVLAKVDEVVRRTDAAITGGKDLVEDLGIPGVITALGMFGLNVARNRRRRQRGEPVHPAEATVSGGGSAGA